MNIYYTCKNTTDIPDIGGESTYEILDDWVRNR